MRCLGVDSMNNDDSQLEEFYSLWKAFKKTYNEDKVLEEYPKLDKLNTIEISIITIVYEKRDVILKEICSMLDVPKSTLTSAIDRLENMHYINRTISKRDRRSYGLELTKEGYEVQSEYQNFEKRAYGYILEALDTEDDRREFVRLIRKITNNT